MLSSSQLYGNSKVEMFLEINALKNVAQHTENMLKKIINHIIRIVESFLDRRNNYI